MRRFTLFLILLILPVALFAQLQVGGTALYNYPLVEDSSSDISASDFTFGADARLKILLFQASGLALFTPGTDLSPANLDLFLDGGITFDVLMFRLGLGAGPNFRVPLGEGSTSGFGLNVKATADLMLGDLSLGLTYLNKFELDFEQAGELLDQNYSQGLFGISLLFSL